MTTTGIDATRVRQVDFSELYLGHPALGDVLSDGHGPEIKPLPRNPALRVDVEQLKHACREAGRQMPSGTEFTVVHDNVPYRVAMMSTQRGRVTVVRRVANGLGTLAELGLPQACIGAMLARDLSGLFLVAGPPKSGKTTTACTMVRERLTLFGGIALTAENPTELPLEGKHGDGVCYQTSAGGGFADAFRRVMRLGPSLALVGEILDRDTAVEALRASAAGCLVISTLRSETLVKSVMKLHALVNEQMVADGARLLANGLAGVLHQRLAGAQSPRPATAFLHLRDAPSARRKIAEGRYDLLSEDIEQQPLFPPAAPGRA